MPRLPVYAQKPISSDGWSEIAACPSQPDTNPFLGTKKIPWFPWARKPSRPPSPQPVETHKRSQSHREKATVKHTASTSGGVRPGDIVRSKSAAADLARTKSTPKPTTSGANVVRSKSASQKLLAAFPLPLTKKPTRGRDPTPVPAVWMPKGDELWHRDKSIPRKDREVKPAVIAPASVADREKEKLQRRETTKRREERDRDRERRPRDRDPNIPKREDSRVRHRDDTGKDVTRHRSTREPRDRSTRDKERERERAGDKDKGKERASEPRDKERDRAKEREKDRTKERDRERDRPRDKDTTPLAREPSRRHHDLGRDKGKEKERDDKHEVKTRVDREPGLTRESSKRHHQRTESRRDKPEREREKGEEARRRRV